MPQPPDILSTMDGVLTALYDDIYSARPWSNALENLRVLMRTNCVCLRLTQKGKRPLEHLFAAGPKVDPESIDEWEQLNSGELGPVPLAAGEYRIVDWSNHSSDPVLAEMLERYDSRQMLTMCIDRFGNIDCVLNCDRGAAEPDFTSADVMFFCMAGRHFARAMRLRRTLASYHVLSEFKSQALDRLAIAAFVFTPIGEIRLLNRSAETLIDRGTCFLVRNGTLRVSDPHADRKLQAAISAMINGEGRGHPQVLPIRDADADRTHHLLIFGAPTTSLLTGKPEACVLMFVRDDVVLRSEDNDLLQTLFSLTPTETNVAVDLANGKRLDDICAGLGITKNTARAHLRSIFQKMGVNRQVDMMHTLLHSVIPLGRRTMPTASPEITDVLYTKATSPGV